MRIQNCFPRMSSTVRGPILSWSLFPGDVRKRKKMKFGKEKNKMAGNFEIWAWKKSKGGKFLEKIESGKRTLAKVGKFFWWVIRMNFGTTKNNLESKNRDLSIGALVYNNTRRSRREMDQFRFRQLTPNSDTNVKWWFSAFHKNFPPPKIFQFFENFLPFLIIFSRHEKIPAQNLFSFRNVFSFPCAIPGIFVSILKITEKL